MTAQRTPEFCLDGFQGPLSVSAEGSWLVLTAEPAQRCSNLSRNYSFVHSDFVIDSSMEPGPQHSMSCCQVSDTHRLDDNKAERKRCEDAGYEVCRSTVDGKPVGPERVWPGGLAMSRTIGDHMVQCHHCLCTSAFHVTALQCV